MQHPGCPAEWHCLCAYFEYAPSWNILCGRSCACVSAHRLGPHLLALPLCRCPCFQPPRLDRFTTDLRASLSRVRPELIDFRQELSLDAALKRLRRSGSIRFMSSRAPGSDGTTTLLRLSAGTFHRFLCLATLHHTGSVDGVVYEEEESEGSEAGSHAEEGEGGVEGGPSPSWVDSDEWSEEVRGGWERLKESRPRRAAAGTVPSPRRPKGRTPWNGWGECWGLEADDVGVVDHVELAQKVRYCLADDEDRMLQEDQCEVAGMHPWLPLRGVSDATVLSPAFVKAIH